MPVFWFVAVAAVSLVACAADSRRGDAAASVVNGRIAFAMRSDLFTIRPDGAGLRRLTSGAADDTEPASSADGRWIAFSRTSRHSKLTSVYVVGQAGGRPRLLVRGARSPLWSPEGHRLAVLRSGASCLRSCPRARELWTVAFTGGDLRLALAGAWSGDWSHSGRELAAMRANGIWVVNVRSGAVRKLSSITGRPGTLLDWSPDGGQLLLVTSNGIVTVSSGDGAVRTLVALPPRPVPDDLRYCLSLDRPIWSPDGRRIAYEEVRCVYDEGAPVLYSTIQIVSSDGVWQHEVNNMKWGNTTDFGTFDAAWSPDSRFLAYIDDALVSAGEYFLETAPVSGSSNRRLRAGVHSAPAWQSLPAP